MTPKDGGLTERCHNVPPEHLFYQRLDVRKVGHIGQRWEPIVPNNPIDLRLSFALSCWMDHDRQVERMRRGYDLDLAVDQRAPSSLHRS